MMQLSTYFTLVDGEADTIPGSDSPSCLFSDTAWGMSEAKLPLPTIHTDHMVKDRLPRRQLLHKYFTVTLLF